MSDVETSIRIWTGARRLCPPERPRPKISRTPSSPPRHLSSAAREVHAICFPDTATDHLSFHQFVSQHGDNSSAKEQRLRVAVPVYARGPAVVVQRFHS